MILRYHDPLIARRRQLCQDMGSLAWPDEARAARDEIMAIDEKLVAEIERLRSENKIIAARAAHNAKQDAARAAVMAAMIKALSDLNESLMLEKAGGKDESRTT